MHIEADFLRDWYELQRKTLEVLGYTLPPDATNEQVSFAFFNVEKRRIEPKPRRVLEASSFVCPQEHQLGYSALRLKIERGEDLRPYLSKGLLKADYDDMLLNDWGIYHLHLGQGPDSKDQSFVARTKEVLFAFFLEDTALVLCLHPHGRGVPPPWEKNELISLLRSNWPDVLEKHLLRGMTGADDMLPEETRRKARQRGVGTFLEYGDGQVYAPPGGGYSTGGIATSVVVNSDRCAGIVADCEKAFREQIGELASQHKVVLPDPVRANMTVEDGRVVVYVPGTPFRVEMEKLG
jgi:hypothetical protein